MCKEQALLTVEMNGMISVWPMLVLPQNKMSLQAGISCSCNQAALVSWQASKPMQRSPGKVLATACRVAESTSQISRMRRAGKANPLSALSQLMAPARGASATMTCATVCAASSLGSSSQRRKKSG